MTKLSFSLACALAFATTTAHAQTPLNHFRASETPDDAFGVSRPDDHGHLRLGAQLHLDYANDPLVYEAALGLEDSEAARVVEHQLTATLGLSLGLLDRFVVFAGLPVHLVMTGDDLLPPGAAGAPGGGLGDVQLGARARLLGESDDFFALALQATVTLPSSSDAYQGDDFLSFHPEVLAELRPGLLRMTANLGVRVRENETYVGNVEIGDELTFGLGLTAPLYGDFRDPSKLRLDLHAQLYGGSSFSNFFGREETPLEAIAGFKVHHPSGFVFGAAGGAGITRGFGSPDGRAILTVGWAQPRELAPEAPPEPSDRDGDGVVDESDACADEAEDADDFEDEDGCPEDDNDGDQLADAQDACPNDAGPAANRGCPDADRDGDTVVDRLDNCPDETGTVENQGCLARQQVQITEGRLVILDKVYFATNRDTIQSRSFRLLDNVARVLDAHPEIARVRVEGHTDDRGDDEKNMQLSQRRAEAVVRYLVERGSVAAGRLDAQGFGETAPIESNDTPTGRANNRRVEFSIVSTSGPTDTPSAPEAGREDTEPPAEAPATEAPAEAPTAEPQGTAPAAGE